MKDWNYSGTAFWNAPVDMSFFRQHGDFKTAVPVLLSILIRVSDTFRVP